MIKLISSLLLLWTINTFASTYDISIEGKDDKIVVTVYKNEDKYKFFTTYKELKAYLKGEDNKITDFVKEVASGH